MIEMALSKGGIIYWTFLCICITTLVEGKVEIIAPFPSNIYPIEGENAQVTCIAFDQDDPNVKPTEIVFVRKDDFGFTTKIADEGTNGHIYFTNRTEVNGRKLFNTMHINGVVPKDDTKQAGRYECQAVGPAGQGGRYGFTVTVISRSEIPQMTVSGDQDVRFHESVSLHCNITHVNSILNKLTSLAWVKDGKKIMEVLHPASQKLDNLDLTIKKPSDGGIYTCKLTGRLRGTTSFEVLGNITISVMPRFTTDKMKGNLVKYSKGEAGQISCAAEGNPIEIVWKRKTDSDSRVTALNQADMSDRYMFKSSTPYKGFYMQISSLEFNDTGRYYCCVKNDSLADTNVTPCQEFILKVTGSTTATPRNGSITQPTTCCQTTKDTSISSTDKFVASGILGLGIPLACSIFVMIRLV